MNIPNIHNSKYTPPPLPEQFAPRGELMARLNVAAQRRIVFVSASEGSGKTVSALLWLEKSRRKTVWIGLDALDNSISGFYRMLCLGLLSAQPDNERINAVLNDPMFNGSPIEHTIELLTAFIIDDEQYVLAMDDFHTITNNEILKSFPYILRRLPHSFVTLILSREEPDDNFAGFMEKEQAAGFTAEALAFDKKEIAEYFSLQGRQISASDAAVVSNITGGWAIGVNVLSQSNASFTGLREQGGQVLGNYIEKHLWSEWDEGLRKFMLASAVLDEMPVSLCAEATGRADAGEVLEQLCMRNAFVSRIEDGVYRYHHLFLDFLRKRPEYEKVDKQKHQNAAAEYYIRANDPITAEAYAFQSEDKDVILRVQLSDMQNKNLSLNESLSLTRDYYLAPHMETLCAKIPILYAPRAYIAFAAGHLGLFENAVDKLRLSLPAIHREHPEMTEAAFAAITLDYRIAFNELDTEARFLPENNLKQNESAYNLGFLTLEAPFLHRSNRDYAEPARNYSQAGANHKNLLKESYETAVLCIKAGFLLERNHLLAALTKALDAVSLITPQTSKEMRFSVYMHLAAAYFALAQGDALADTIREAEQFINNEARHLRPNFLAFTARTRLWDGDTGTAKEWLAHYFVNVHKTLELYRIYQYFTTARAYAVLGELEKAKDLSLRLRQLGKDFCRLQDTAEAGALLAAILWAQGKKDEAQEMLEAVLLELQPYDFIRLVADEGAAIAPALKKISAKCERADYTGELNPAYVKSVYLAAYAVSKQRRGIMANLKMKPVKLSKRQKQVIELLAQGHNRKGVMEQTGMNLELVKAHTRHAYEKLGVGNAADAVLRAKELGIIE